MLRYHPYPFLLCLGLLLGSQPGCREQTPSAAPTLVPVSGQVVLDGEPVAGAKVVFLPQRLFSAGNRVQPAASALTDQQGHFSLQTAGNTGAGTGPYWVLLSKRDNVRDEDAEQWPEELLNRKLSELGATPESSDRQPEELFPDFFNSATRLQFTVPDQGTDSARFELSIFDRPLEQPRR